MGLATAVSPFASANPDGLEKVAEDKAFLDEGRLAGVQEDSPIPDYAFPGVENERVATGLAASWARSRSSPSATDWPSGAPATAGPGRPA